MQAQTAQEPATTRLLRKAAQQLGYTFTVLDPAFGYLCEVRRGNRRRVLIGGVSPVNEQWAGRLCTDKHYTNVVLAGAGIGVPQTARCLSPTFFRQPDYAPRVGLAPARALADALGCPLLVKPNSLSKGIGVEAVPDLLAMEKAVQRLWDNGSPVVLVQEVVRGRDLRLNVLDGEYLGGYERTQVQVVGDGVRTRRDLLREMGERFQDPAFVRAHAHDLGALDDVPAKGERIAFGSDVVLNLNQLATARLLETMPYGWLAWCNRVGSALGVRHFGIDLRARSDNPTDFVVVEVNASPLLTGMIDLGFEAQALRAQRRVLQAAFSD